MYVCGQKHPSYIKKIKRLKMINYEKALKEGKEGKFEVLLL